MILNTVKPKISTGAGVHRYHARPQAREALPRGGMTVNETSAELLIYDDIGDYWGMGVTAEDTVKAITGLPDACESLTVRINSPGGDVFDGATIYNALARLQIPVNVHVDGLAASIASIVAMAGDTITMAANSMMMIHKPWMVSMGDADELRHDAATLDQVEQGLLRIYTARTGQPKETVAELLAAETWMTAEEAKALGFCETITDPVGASAHRDLSAYPYQKAPKAWTEPEDPPPVPVDYAGRVAALAERLRTV